MTTDDCTVAGAATAASVTDALRHSIPETHPRAESLHIRHRLVKGFEDGLVAAEGLLAHGRGEAFDYLLGEGTSDVARRACKAAAVALYRAERPVISINGNAASLCADQLVRLADQTGAAVEINLFYDSDKRRAAIARHLRAHGAAKVLGADKKNKRVTLDGTDSARRMVDEGGIWAADVVLVPLEDGDRTGALKQAGKTVIAIDLNPLSRTAQTADISIIDNITRAIGVIAKEYQGISALERRATDVAVAADFFDNAENLRRATEQIRTNLDDIAGRRRDA